MDRDILLEKINIIVDEYPIKKITLFGSRASGTHRPDSDVDLIIEFYKPISLLTLSKVRVRLEELLGLKVDVVHGPLRDDDMLEVDEIVVLYDAINITNNSSINFWKNKVYAI